MKIDSIAYLGFAFVMVLSGCSSSNSPVPTEVVAGEYPPGSVKTPYEALPGRVKVEVYNGENIVAEGDYLDGLKEGTWTEYDVSSGRPVSVTTYHKGQKQGIVLNFNARNGNLEKKSYYHLDRLNGQYMEYQNRRKVEESTYVNGGLEGMKRRFYTNGKIQEESNYRNGTIDGVARWYDQEGNLSIEYIYENGNFVTDNTAEAKQNASSE